MTRPYLRASSTWEMARALTMLTLGLKTPSALYSERGHNSLSAEYESCFHEASDKDERVNKLEKVIPTLTAWSFFRFWVFGLVDMCLEAWECKPTVLQSPLIHSCEGYAVTFQMLSDRSY